MGKTFNTYNFTEAELQKLLKFAYKRGEISTTSNTIKKSRLRALLRWQIETGELGVTNPELLGQTLNEHAYLEDVPKELGVYKLKMDKILEEKGEI